MIQLLTDILYHLRAIQLSGKGSIGSIDNTYLPQLAVKDVDALTDRVLLAEAKWDSKPQAICDLCKQPLPDEEGVQLWRWVLHPGCKAEAESRLMRFWDYLMSEEFGEDIAEEEEAQ